MAPASTERAFLFAMTKQLIAILGMTAVLSLPSVSFAVDANGNPEPAPTHEINTKAGGTVKGGVIGGLAGSVVGHPVAGGVIGAAVGHHRRHKALKQARKQEKEQQAATAGNH